MSEQNFDLEYYKSAFDQVPEPITDLSLKPYFRLASFYLDFNVQEILSQTEKIWGQKLDKSDKILLREYSKPVRTGNETRRFITDSDRNQIFRSFKSKQEFSEIAHALGVEIVEVTQRALIEYISESAKPLEAQDVRELVATYRVCRWLAGSLIIIPRLDQVEFYLKRWELLTPFVELTRNFKGRRDELAVLSDYVDWLPKTSLVSSVSGYIRTTIRWDEKPPLMLTGIGGIGKSTIIAKFIVDQVVGTSKRGLPFVYFDFDRPGYSISNPMSLVAEALEQLKFQFPQHIELFNKVQALIVDLYSRGSDSSHRSDRDYLFKEYLSSIDLEPLSNLEVPVLAVFDSFEEIQYRSRKHELENLFAFLKEIMGTIPRFRVVFAGRSEMLSKGFKFQELKIPQFDEESADGFLEAVGIKNGEVRRLLFEKVKGNPLTLRLAAELAKKEKITNLVSLDNIKTRNFFAFSLDENLIQEQLVKRNLDHVHDKQVKKIAVPGILIRKITPQVIQNVLAEPCGLGVITLDVAITIFEKLKRETFLVTQFGDAISFRQDLRMSLYDLIVKDKKYDSGAIHARAVEFYQQTIESKPEDRAEYLYHRLKRGDRPEDLDSLITNDTFVFLESSMTELPPDAALHLSIRFGLQATESSIKNSGLSTWQRYMRYLINGAFQGGDEQSLKSIADMLSKRRERADEGEFWRFECKLMTRLGEFKSAMGILTNMKRPLQPLEGLLFDLQKAKIFEYQKMFHEAYDSFSKIAPSNITDAIKDHSAEAYEVYIDWSLMVNRLMRRLGATQPPFKFNVRLPLFDSRLPILPERLPTPYRQFASGRAIVGGGDPIEEILNSSFYRQDMFVDLIDQVKYRVKSLTDLEELSQSLFDLFLKDTVEPGSIDVLIYDICLLLELTNWRGRAVTQTLFLSQSPEDTNLIFPVAKELLKFLNAESDIKFELEEHMSTEHPIELELETQLQRATVAIVFLSPLYIRSEWCQLELDYLFKNHVNLIPVYVRERELTDKLMPDRYRGIQMRAAIDFEKSGLMSLNVESNEFRSLVAQLGREVIRKSKWANTSVFRNRPNSRSKS